MYKIFSKVFSIILVFSCLFFLTQGRILATNDETIKIIQYRDRITENGDGVGFINAITDYIIGGAQNAFLSVISSYKDDININPQNTYFTSSSYSGGDIELGDGEFVSGISFVHNNNSPTDTVDTLNIGSDFYASNQIAPRNPTSILPIYKPCDRIELIDGSITYTNCTTYVTTDNKPLFVSFYANGNTNFAGGFTIVDIRDDSDDSLVSNFYMGDSLTNDLSVNAVQNGSYTFATPQTQDRSQLFIPNGGGNLNLNGITTTTYDTLSHGTYRVYMQNINRFGLKSNKIFAGYLEIIPPEDTLQNFEFIDIYQSGVGIRRNIVNGKVSINYTENAVVTLDNPGNYSYNVHSLSNSDVTITGNTFEVATLVQGDNIFNVEILDGAGNVLNNKSLIIRADTVGPVIREANVNENFIDVPTSDNAISVKEMFSRRYVNDNVILGGVSTSIFAPFMARVLDNSSLDGITLQYSNSYNGTYSNVSDIQALTNNRFEYNVNVSTLVSDGDYTIYLKAIDSSGNESDPFKLDFGINRNASAPIILTNGGGKVVTSQDQQYFSLELQDDITELFYGGLQLTDYVPFSKYYDGNLDLLVGEHNYGFRVKDVMGNISPDSYITIIRRPPPIEGVTGSDSTIHFEAGVTSDSIDLQRMTEDGTPGEIFSK